MRNSRRIRWDAWLLPRSRALLFALLIANLGLFGLVNVLTRGPAETNPVAAPAFRPEVELRLVTRAEHDPQPAALLRECRIWGPLDSADGFAKLMARLREQGGFPEVQEAVVQTAPDYLVYIEDLGSREAAKRTARELESIEIESYLINRDAAGPILSVGVFSQERLAKRQLERLQGLGYAVSIETLERNQTVYQLAAHIEVGSADYETSISPCPAIAQGR